MAYPEKVELIGRCDNFLMPQGTIEEITIWKKTIPGGTLGTKNSLRLSMQWGCCAKKRRLCADDEAPGMQALVLDSYWNPPAGNTRASWSYMMLDPETGLEMTYEAIYNNSESTNKYHLYRVLGDQTWTEVDMVPLVKSAGDSNSNQSIGIADDFWYSWYYLFGFTIFSNYSDNREVWTNNSNVPAGWDWGDFHPWTIYDNVLYGIAGQGALSGVGGIHSMSMEEGDSEIDGSARALASAEWARDWWFYSMQATANWLYAIAADGSGNNKILKINKDDLTLADTYDLGLGDYTEALAVVSDDLIFFTYSEHDDPVSIGYWSGGATGSVHWVDMDVQDFSWAIWNKGNPFTSYKTMRFMIGPDGLGYFYMGTDGANGNATGIFKIGGLDCSGIMVGVTLPAGGG